MFLRKIILIVHKEDGQKRNLVNYFVHTNHDSNSIFKLLIWIDNMQILYMFALRFF